MATAGRKARGRRAARVLTGLEVLARERPRWLRGRRVGLLLHPASVTAELVSARDVVRHLCGEGLRALFGPQHGFAGEKLEGNLIRPGYTSFVGLYPVPMRHGLTLGELAALVNLRMADGGGRPVRRTDGVGVRCPGRCALTVVPMEGWRRRMLFPDTGLPWVLPSPNMPTFDTAVVYPGQVLLEGTNVSEGRGTTRPFEIFGAPWLDLRTMRRRFERRRLPGLVLRDHAFEPTFHKWAERLCLGFQIHVTDRAAFLPYLTTVALLQDLIAEHREHFAWKQPPYEYVTDRLPIDVLLGDPAVREVVESGADLRVLARSWRREIEAFRREALSVRLYR